MAGFDRLEERLSGLEAGQQLNDGGPPTRSTAGPAARSVAGPPARSSAGSSAGSSAAPPILPPVLTGMHIPAVSGACLS